MTRNDMIDAGAAYQRNAHPYMTVAQARAVAVEIVSAQELARRRVCRTAGHLEHANRED